MRPYGIKIKDRRPMYDYGSDKYNSRGCFNTCGCYRCRNKKSKIRKQTSRSRIKLNTLNRMRSAKKKERFQSKYLIKEEINNINNNSMKSIEQGAQEYADKTYPKIGLNEDWADDGFDEGYNAAKNKLSIADFKAGVEFAQQWISPNDEMPPVGESVQVKIKWRDQEYSYDHDKRVIADGYDDFEINQMIGLEVVGWRPINLK